MVNKASGRIHGVSGILRQKYRSSSGFRIPNYPRAYILIRGVQRPGLSLQMPAQTSCRTACGQLLD